MFARKLLFSVLFVLLAAQLVGRPVSALPPPPEVPDALKPWQAWMLHDEPALLCTSWGDGRACEWPGHLQVRIDKEGGGFSLDVWLDQPAVVALPGDAGAWPQQVTVNDVAAIVQLDGSRPALRLPAGHHKVAAVFAWAEAPELLALPKEIGVIELTLLGTKVDVARRDDAGRLLLQKDGSGTGAETDSLTVTVARRVRDGVPLRLTTRLTLRVGGKARDAVLGAVLPLGWRPVGIHCPLPVQVGGDGAVRVHVRPGQHVLDIEAVLPVAVAHIEVPTLIGGFFESPETWVWVPDEAVRSVEVSGLTSVDPDRTQLDSAWKKGRSYLGEPGQKLQLKVARRGEIEPAPNHIELSRHWWLDLDGEGLTSRDVLHGQLHQTWRLGTAGGWQLGRAEVSDRNQLITLPADGSATVSQAGAGVELRGGNLRMEADVRLDSHKGALAAVGWSTDVQKLSAVLHLPPGWTLLSATGVDKLPTTWTDSWDLLDFFFVLMLSLGFAKLLGKGWGLATAALLVVCHGQPDAPGGVLLAALACLALLAVLPQGRFRKGINFIYACVLIGLVVEVVPFCADQIRHGIYPQVASPVDMGGGWLLGRAGKGEMAPPLLEAKMAEQAATDAPTSPAPAPMESPAAREEDKEMAKKDELSNVQAQQAVDPNRNQRKLTGKTKGGWSKRGSFNYDLSTSDDRQLQQIDPQAVVQTGPGVPTWQWSDWPLTWNGPVRADHQVQLYLLSPLHNLLLALLRAVLVVLLALKLVDVGRLRKLASALQPPAATMGLLVMIALGLPNLGQASEAPFAAQMQNNAPPTTAVLQTLHDRLVAAQHCEGPCLVVSQLQVRLQGQRFVLQAALSAQRSAAWTVPGPLDALQLEQVTLDGKPTRDLRRDDQGLLRLRVPAGHHVVQVTGNLARRNVIDVQLGSEALPKQVRMDAPGWAVDGLDSNGVPQQSLQLTRREVPLPAAATQVVGVGGAVNPATAATATDAAVELPPWYGVERHLQLGLPWTVQTTVRRDSAERPQLVKVPLLAGEVVLTDGVRVEEIEPGKPQAGRRALVTFARGETVVTLEGQLPLPDGAAAAITLVAPSGEAWTETWRLDCSPIWRCSWQGLPPTHSRDSTDAALRPLWQPWPGETLQVQVRRPAGAPGQSITIDHVQYTLEPGQRLLAATLVLRIRTSQGGVQKLTLPPGAEVQSVVIAGQAKTLRPQGQLLLVPLNPGQQEITVKWQQAWQRQIHETVPQLDLGGAAANLQISLKPGESRWLLFAHGPKWGAAVLFWSRLLLALLVAVALGRIGGLPLKTRQWLVLSLGLAPLPVPLALVVIGWFLAMGWRRRYGSVGRDGLGQTFGPVVHNLLQIALFGWGLAALGCLYGAIHSNLLGDLDMQVQGAGSTQWQLQWIIDRTTGKLPDAGMVSLPLWLWRALMLGWALWLAAALLRWLPWAWQALTSGRAWLAWTGTIAVPQGTPDSPPPPPPAPAQQPDAAQ